MEFLIIMVVAVAYGSLSSKLDKILNKQDKDNKKKFPSLQKLIGKNISIETSNELDLVFGSETKGILKEFNDIWLVIETTNKKNKKEEWYYRLNNIVSIDLIEK